MNKQTNSDEQEAPKLSSADEPTGLLYFNPPSVEVADLLTEGEALVRSAERQLKAKLAGSLDSSERLELREYDSIGPVRCLYYRELILSTIYSALTDGTPHAGKSYFVGSGVKRDQNDWLVYDMLLSRFLASLGISWDVIEDAMLRGFYAGLPESFKRQHGMEPCPQTLVDWQTTWTNRDRLKQGFKTVAAGSRKAKQAAKFLEGLETSATSLDQRLLRPETIADLRNLVTLGKSVVLSERTKIIDFRTVRKSPVVTAVVVRLSECLWEAVTNESPSPIHKGERLAPHKYGKSPLVVDMKDGSVTTEFWMLVSDLFYHCPILRGVPETGFLAIGNGQARPVPYQQNTPGMLGSEGNKDRSKPATASWPKISEDAIRGRCEEHYTRNIS